MSELFKDAPQNVKDILISATGRYFLEDADLSTSAGWEEVRRQHLSYADQIEVALKLWRLDCGTKWSQPIQGETVTICDQCRKEMQS